MSRHGHNFERSAILSWLSRSTECPLTRKPLKPSDLLPNRSLEQKIRVWKETNGIEATKDNRDACLDRTMGFYLCVSGNAHAQLLRLSLEHDAWLLSLHTPTHTGSTSQQRRRERVQATNLQSGAERRAALAIQMPAALLTSQEVSRLADERRRRFLSRLL